MTSTREEAKEYLANHRIPQMFEGLLSCLMMERPEDPVAFIETKMGMIKEIGLDSVNWETFVYHLHPYRDSVRCELIRDGTSFDKEYQIELELKNSDKENKTSEQGMTKSERDLKKSEPGVKKSNTSLKNDPSTSSADSYEPELFELTENGYSGS